jgi:hypothetical protein
VYESRPKEGSGSHILKLNVLKETTEPQQRVLNGITTGIGEIWAKVGLPLAKRSKKGTPGMEEID